MSLLPYHGASFKTTDFTGMTFVAGLHDGSQEYLRLYDEFGNQIGSLESAGLPLNTYVNKDLNLIIELTTSSSASMRTATLSPLTRLQTMDYSAVAMCVHEGNDRVYIWTQQEDIYEFVLSDLPNAPVGSGVLVASVPSGTARRKVIAVREDGSQIIVGGYKLGNDDSDFIVFNTTDWSQAFLGTNSGYSSSSYCVDISDKYLVSGHQYNNQFTVYDSNTYQEIPVTETGATDSYTAEEVLIDDESFVGIINSYSPPYPNKLVKYSRILEGPDRIFTLDNVIDLPDSNSSDGEYKFIRFNSDKTKIYVSGNNDSNVLVFSYPELDPLPSIDISSQILGPFLDIP